MIKPKTEWVLEDYQREIYYLRAAAKAKRRDADALDAEADVFRKEAARFSTEKLPLFKESNEAR